MTHRIAIRLHARLTAWLAVAVAAVLARLRTAPQGGQGTVEYVALILLVAGVLAVAVAAAGKSSFKFDQVVTDQLKKAIETVGK